jgi:hypothetical protein
MPPRISRVDPDQFGFAGVLKYELWFVFIVLDTIFHLKRELFVNRRFNSPMPDQLGAVQSRRQKIQGPIGDCRG